MWTNICATYATKQKRHMRFGTWNVRSLYRAGSFTAAAGELARRFSVQACRLGGTKRAQ